MAEMTVFDPAFVERAYHYALLGTSDVQMASFFAVKPTQLARWRREQPLFVQAIAQGRALADAQVAQALFRRATGFELLEEDVRTVSGEVVITQVTKRYPPETSAAIFWLKNRRPDLWRDRPGCGITETEEGGVTAIEVMLVRAAEVLAVPETQAQQPVRDGAVSGVVDGMVMDGEQGEEGAGPLSGEAGVSV